MKKVLLLVVVLILYGSFYPWNFQNRTLPENPLWILLHSWPYVVNRFVYRDAVVNFALYLPFGVVGFLAMSRIRSRALRAAAVVAAAMLLSASIEMAQLFAPDRVCSLFDVSFNTAGAAAGILLAFAFPAPLHQVLRGSEAAGVFRPSAVIALLYLWAGFLLFPFFPDFGRTAALQKLTALLSSGAWTLRDFLESFGGWLSAAALLETLAGRRRFGRALAIAMLLVPLKILIVQRTMSGSEAVGAAAGAGTWIALRSLKRPALAAGVLAIAAIAVGGLLPFQFSAAPQAFVWIPFLPLLRAPWESGFLILLRKSFLYGSAVWLLKADRRRWLSSSLIVAATLAVIEVIQVFLPGRTPELTDPLLALLLGFGLMQLERRSGT